MFGAPLYARYALNSVEEGGFRMFTQPLFVDGHCPYCQQPSTFRRANGTIEILKLAVALVTARRAACRLGCTRSTQVSDQNTREPVHQADRVVYSRCDRGREHVDSGLELFKMMPAERTVPPVSGGTAGTDPADP